MASREPSSSAGAATPKSAAEQWVVWSDYSYRVGRLIKTTPTGFKAQCSDGGREIMVRSRALFTGSRQVAVTLAADLTASRKIAEDDAHANTLRRKGRDAAAIAKAIKAQAAQ